MAEQVKWQLSGDYFENCNCSVVCPCLVSKAAPLTSRPTEGVCDVPLIFHIDNGRYGDVALDGLNVALRHPHARTDGGRKLVGGRLHRPTRRRRADCGAGRDLHRRRRRTDGGVRAADRANPRCEKGPDYLPHRWQEAFCGNPGHPAHVSRSAADGSSERRDVGEHRPSGRPRQAGARRRRSREHVRRSWDALGQFRQERPLRADPLVKSAVTVKPSSGGAGDILNK